jgi:beta-lactamase class A
MRLRRWRAVLGAAIVAAAPAFAADADARREALAALGKISADSGGTLGVSAIDLKTGERLQFNAGERFPMASTFKVPVAITLLHEVDQGRMDLRDVIVIDRNNVSPGSGELRQFDADAPKNAPMEKLLELMLRESDNTATDYLLARAGGPAGVTHHMRDLGIDDIRIDRPTFQLVADAWGFKLPPEGQRNAKSLGRARQAVSAESRERAAQRVLADPRDTTTPDAMVSVIALLQEGKALGKETTELVIDNMEKCKTGPKRIKGELPRQVTVAHKTGTLTRVVTGDAGIVSPTWPNRPFVLAVYLKGSPLPMAAQERAIAQASLVAYRYFTR